MILTLTFIEFRSEHDSCTWEVVGHVLSLGQTPRNEEFETRGFLLVAPLRGYSKVNLALELYVSTILPSPDPVGDDASTNNVS